MSDTSKDFKSTEMSKESNQINIENDRYPCSIVWTPLPIISWLIPLIGHMGICYSNGVIRDFAGPYIVTVKSMIYIE
jgi:hypothetical protein